MPTPFPLMLAIDWGALIWIGVVLFVTFGSAVGNWLKKQAEAREAARRREQALMSPHTLAGQGRSGSRRDGATPGDAASRRAEQLRELARQRTQMSTADSARAPGATQPRNLTMAERIARARAQEEYARRAAELQSQAGRGGQPTPQQQAQQEAARRQRVAAAAKMQREQAARQRAAQQRARAQHPTPQPSPQRPQPRPASSQQSGARSRTSQTQRSASGSRRMATPAAAAPAKRAPAAPRRSSGGSSNQGGARRAPRISSPVAAAGGAQAPSVTRLAGLSRQSLRQAFVLKEILDRPVAMREPGDHGLL